MTTNKELRELAEKAKSGSWFESGDLRYEDARSGYMHGLHHDEDGFIAAASPDRVLELLDENEALQAECERLRKAAEKFGRVERSMKTLKSDYIEGSVRMVMVMDTLQSKLEGVRKTLDYKLAKVQSDFAYGLSSFMTDKGVSKKELAERIGKTEEYIDNLLSGDVNFTIEEAVKVLDVLGARLSLSVQPQNECKMSLEVFAGL